MKRAGAHALLLAAAAAGAAEPDVSVTRDGDLYSIHMQAQLGLAAATVHDTFARFENLPRINPAVEQVQRRPGPADATRLYTQVRVCVAFFCTRMHQVQDIRSTAHDGSYDIDARVLPEQSDLKRGSAHWHIAPCGAGSCLDFAANLEPDFWVPPLIGPWLIQRKLKEEARVTVRGIERVAHEDAR